MFEKLIKKIAISLDKAKIPYMIIGGQAVLVYGTPRLTRDIDLTLGIDSDEFLRIKDICKKTGLKILTANLEEFVNETKVLPAEDRKTKIRLDFIFSFTTYEREALARIKKIFIAGYPVKFASCEDIIIHKIIAGRAVDQEDIKNILIKNQKKINYQYIDKWLKGFRMLPELEQAIKVFSDLRQQC